MPHVDPKNCPDGKPHAHLYGSRHCVRCGSYVWPTLDLHEQERLRVQAESPKSEGWVAEVLKHASEGQAAERYRVLALIDRELEHVRLADGPLGDVLRALRKDVEEGYDPGEADRRRYGMAEDIRRESGEST
jgi:hypothetical protein